MYISTPYDTVQFNTRSNCAVGIRIRILLEILVMNHLLQNNNNNNNNNNNKHDKIQQIYFENHRSAVFKKKSKAMYF